MAAEREHGISFNICQKIGVIATYQTGWKKEVNLVEWNDGPAKFDIRDWDPSHTHMGKGITMYREEADRLRWILYRYFTGKGAEKDPEEIQESGVAEEVAAEEDAEKVAETEKVNAEELDTAAEMPVFPAPEKLPDIPAPEEVEEALRPSEESF